MLRQRKSGEIVATFVGWSAKKSPQSAGETRGKATSGRAKLWGVTRLTGRRPALGSTIQAKPDVCPACHGRRIVRDGVRKNSFRQLQIYWCKDCRAHFSSLTGLKGVKYPPRLIARALSLYSLGNSQEEVARRIASEHRIAVPRRTISDWISGYRPITTFHRLRAAAVEQFGHNMLRQRTLDHQQVYEYKVHLAKLALMEHAVPANVAAKVKSYLLSIFEDFPDSLFQDGDRTPNLDQQVAADDGRREPPAPTATLRSSKSRSKRSRSLALRSTILPMILPHSACCSPAGTKTATRACRISC